MNISGVSGAESIPDVIKNIIGFILPIAGGLALMAVIYGGVLYITSSGEPDKTQKAKRTILWALLGVIIIVLAYAIVVTLNRVLNTEIL